MMTTIIAIMTGIGPLGLFFIMLLLLLLLLLLLFRSLLATMRVEEEVFIKI